VNARCTARGLHDAGDVRRLVAFGAFGQIELYGLAFIQGAVTLLLDGGVMDEDIFAG